MKQTRPRAKAFIVAALAVVLFSASLGRSEAFLDKTRFAAHLGIAYFCFHHWVLRPYEQGKFANGTPGRTGTLVKGGAALLFAVHEVKVASKIAHGSQDPLLQKMVGGLDSLSGSFGSIGEKLKSGHFSPQDIAGLSAATTLLGTAAAADGAPVKDVPVAVPGM